MTTPPRESFEAFFSGITGTLETEWALFATSIEHRYNFQDHVIIFQAGHPLTDDLHLTEVDSSKSWQSTLVQVEAGRACTVAATGFFDLQASSTDVPGNTSESPRWISEANGISIHYHKGQPLGRLLGAIHAEGQQHSMLQTIPLGNNASFTPTQSGTLYLRINDRPDSLADNRGLLSVSIRSSE